MLMVRRGAAVFPLTILAAATAVLVIVTAVIPTQRRRQAAVEILGELTKLVGAILGQPEAQGVDLTASSVHLI
jgi:hypothetical protein